MKLQELHDLVEAELQISFYMLNQERTKILVKINGKEYEYTPTDIGPIPLFNSFSGMMKHSKGRALQYLKKHSVGRLIAESDANRYTPEQIIDAFTKMYKDTGNPLDGDMCGEVAYIYNYLNKSFIICEIKSDNKEENLSHIAVTYNNHTYDGRGLFNDSYSYQPVKLVTGTNEFNSTFMDKDGNESACGVTNGGNGAPSKAVNSVYSKVLKYFE